jgi:hypothetical protein
MEGKINNKAAINTREEARPFIQAGADCITTDTKLFEPARSSAN